MNHFKIGQFAESKASFSKKDVIAFSQISKDKNPVHLDENFAADSMFKKPIVHGFLYGSMLSALIANQLPGPGSVYMYQDMKFIAPVYYDEVLVAKVVITEMDGKRKIITLNTTIYKEADNSPVISGVAKIKYLGS